MLLSQFQQPHTASVSLLFHPAGGQDRINHLTCVDSNRICPSTETVTVPFQIFLMIWRHMFYYRGVLAAPAMETAMRGDPVVMIKYFNRCFCYAHIDLIFDILIRHGVVHLVYCDVVVELDSGLFPLSQFEGCGRQRCQQWLFFPKK